VDCPTKSSKGGPVLFVRVELEPENVSSDRSHLSEQCPNADTGFPSEDLLGARRNKNLRADEMYTSRGAGGGREELAGR